MKIRTIRCALGAGLLLCSAAVATANSLVYFQVNMSNAVFTSSFNPATQTMAVRGSFDNWAAVPLTNNPSAPDTNLWTGAFLVTSNVYNGTTVSANGTVMSYKYTTEPDATYEIVFLGGSHNRLLLLPPNNGDSITAPQVFYGDSAQTLVTNNVVFQVDLAQQIQTEAFIPGTSTAQARGIFNGWGGTAVAQTNDPTILRTNANGLVTSNVYVGTYQIVGSPGQTVDYKYYIDTGANWDSPAPSSGDPADNNNRFFNLGDASSQTLPIVFFSDSPYAPLATNDITFQVDMSSQILVGNFIPGGTVELRGDFNSWGTPQILCTNDPAAANTNIYSTVVTIKDGVGARHAYKFWASVTANGGWETMADNRIMQIVNARTLVLPPVYFDNVYIDPNDVVPQDTVVTFSVNMTNAMGTDSVTFNPATDVVAINGLPPTGFAAWGVGLLTLTNNPVGSQLYSLDYTVPKGSSVILTYKYGINANDDEAAAGQNHVRVIRQGGTYVLPLDKFGNQHVEPTFGQLTVGKASAGHVPVSWLGHTGVHLQTKADLSSGSWQDLLETSGATWQNGYGSPDGFVSVTNYPIGAAKTFFRFVKP